MLRLKSVYQLPCCTIGRSHADGLDHALDEATHGGGTGDGFDLIAFAVGFVGGGHVAEEPTSVPVRGGADGLPAHLGNHPVCDGVLEFRLAVDATLPDGVPDEEGLNRGLVVGAALNGLHEVGDGGHGGVLAGPDDLEGGGFDLGHGVVAQGLEHEFQEVGLKLDAVVLADADHGCGKRLSVSWVQHGTPRNSAATRVLWARRSAPWSLPVGRMEGLGGGHGCTSSSQRCPLIQVTASGGNSP